MEQENKNSKLTPGAHNTGSRKNHWSPVSQMGTSENGRGARKSGVPVGKANNPTKPQTKEPSNQKKSFRP